MDMHKHFGITILIFLLSACGSGNLNNGTPMDEAGAPGPRLTQNPVGFQMQLVGNGVAAAPGLIPAQSSDAGTLTVTSATVHVASVKLDAPDDWDCSRFNLEVEVDDDGHDSDETETEDESSDDDESLDDSESSDDLESSDLAPQSSDSAGGTVSGKCENEEDGEGAEIEFIGPFRLNLLTGESTPPLTDLTIPPGTYQRISLEIDEVEDEDDVDQNDPLYAHSVLLYGSYTTATAMPMRITLQMDEEIRFDAPEGSGGFTIGPEGGQDIVVRISTGEWFAGIAAEIDACIAEAEDEGSPGPVTNGVLVLDDASDTDAGENCVEDVADALKDNLTGAGEVDEDESDDSDDDSDDSDDQEDSHDDD